jgi:hypothetical protein
LPGTPNKPEVTSQYELAAEVVLSTLAAVIWGAMT